MNYFFYKNTIFLENGTFFFPTFPTNTQYSNNEYIN